MAAGKNELARIKCGGWLSIKMQLYILCMLLAAWSSTKKNACFAEVTGPKPGQEELDTVESQDPDSVRNTASRYNSTLIGVNYSGRV